ncbi:MAG: ABC transporter ATP-binding protein, partial [Aeromicrobium sp.]
MTIGSKERTGLEVRIEDLRRSFGDNAALDGLTLTLAPGELVALLGPSGCGKTTALRIVAGLDEPDSGRVVVGDKDVTNVTASKRGMGMVFQAYSLFPHMTSQENVEFGLKLRGVDTGKRSTKAREMLDLVGLAEFANRYASQLSGGQQQRVALARALAIEPAVLLLDEPLSALDAKVRVQLRDEIRRIQLEVGTTALFVTHDQEEALAIADRVGVMNKGKLAQLDAPEELYARPADSFVAAFVGLMNRLPCTVAGGYTELLGSHTKTLENSVESGPGLALVRPEQVSIQAGDTGTSTVKHLSFLGSFSR